MLLLEVHAEQPQLAHLPVELAVNARLGLALLVVRAQALARESLRNFAQSLLIFGQEHGESSYSCTRRAPRLQF